MSLAALSIKRPIFITCLIILMIVVGLVSFKSLPVDQMPDVTFPTVTVTVNYSGTGPREMETLVAKPLEDEIGTISGLKKMTSSSLEGIVTLSAEFNSDVNIQNAEQQVRDKVALAKATMPEDINEPLVKRVDPDESSVVTVSLRGDLSERELYDLADLTIKTRLEQISGVGQVEVAGGRKREIQVQLDRDKLTRREFSVTAISSALQAAGENVPGGKVNSGDIETVFRSLGEFENVRDISDTVVSLQSNEIPTRISDVGVVLDTLEDETSRVYVNGQKSLFINVYKQSGTNTLAVVDGVKSTVALISQELDTAKGKPQLLIVQDSSKAINDNVYDVEETIIIGILLTVLVVFFFLGSWRSTLITGLALPNSLIGCFILMAMAGFTINIISLLAMSVAVGLLIDDAIVVRENIFRHLEAGADAKTAALEGTKEVTLAVIATTAVVIAVFAPVGFMSGIIGQFLKQFGLTICFAMAISLFDALTIAPMLSAYLAEANPHAKKHSPIWDKTLGPMLKSFDQFQTWLEDRYEVALHWILRHPIKTILGGLVVFVLSTATVVKIPMSFVPNQDSGEFSISLDTAPGTNLDAMDRIAVEADQLVRKHPEVSLTTVTVGGRNGEAYKASLYVKLVEADNRKIATEDFKALINTELLASKTLSAANPKVQNSGAGGGAASDFSMNLLSTDSAALEPFAEQVLAKLKQDPRFFNVDTSYRVGKPEFQVKLKPGTASVYGINTKTIGTEIRGQIEGTTPVKFREAGNEYEVRVRLKPDQRDLQENFSRILVPNINSRLVKLSDVASGLPSAGAASIERENRARYIQITAGIRTGVGTNEALAAIKKITTEDLKMPSQVRISYGGSTERFQEMLTSMLTAIGFAILLIFLVLASLYESFITPFTIMLALPLAICGAFLGLFLAGEPLSLFAMLGIIMLLGVASKNSILMVDSTLQKMEQGVDRERAIIEAGKSRLRPILMTSIALIAGMIPVAIGLNAASAQRTSMGYAIIGGLVSSTLLTLLIVPAAFVYIDRFRVWSGEWMKRLFSPQS